MKLSVNLFIDIVIIQMVRTRLSQQHRLIMFVRTIVVKYRIYLHTHVIGIVRMDIDR